MEKPAPADHEIHELIRARYSARAFDPRPIDTDTLRSLFEAARWAPSSMNEQPWRYVLVRRESRAAFDSVVSTLSGHNPRWAKDASVFIIAAAKLRLERNDQLNRHALHDVGMSSAWLLLEATARNLVLHPMGGFDQEKLCALSGIPEGFEAVTVWAVAHPGEPDLLPDDLRTRELAPRVRRPQSGFVFEGAWGCAFEG